ncbi:MAG: hypothetical protein NZ704_14130, partial [Geminicoccaceae bacterium]|nr:hypothetical protein [Geminicoccaceae bacterium]
MRALWLALLASGLATSATAQSLIDPDRAWLRRKVDALELRAATDPVGAAEEARALGRELRRAAGAGDGERLRLERRLERIAAGPPRTVVSPGPPRGLDPPPSSLERELFASERDPLRTADLLLARAAEGLAEGRLDAARSDLSLAAAELAVL